MVEKDLLDFDPLADRPAPQAQAAVAATPAIGTAGSAISLSEEEKAYYGQCFRTLSPGGNGLIAPQAAGEFFKKSGLPNPVLSEIWVAAEIPAVGLGPPEFFKVLKLIALQQGKLPAKIANLGMSSPLPKFEGVPLPSPAPATSPAIPKPDAPAAAASLLEPGRAERFKVAFESCSPVNGSITGFLWDLVFDKTGATGVSQRQFYAAMYVIFRFTEGTLNVVPAAIPQPLWDAIDASIKPAAATSAPAPAPLATPAPAVSAVVSATPASTTDWAIPPEERTAAYQYFDQLDVNKRGFLTGEDSYEFFLKSKLDSEALATIWDLSNIKEKGRLSRDEFTLAMHLIRAKLAGKPLPNPLPENLIPPSSRKPTAPATALPAFKPPAPVVQEPKFAAPLPTSSTIPSLLPSSPSSGFSARPEVAKSQIPSLAPISFVDSKTQPKSPTSDFSKLAAFDLAGDKRSNVETELRAAIAKKQELTLKLSQAKVTYQAEEDFLNENFVVLREDSQIMEAQEGKIGENDQILATVKRDRQNQQNALAQHRSEIDKVRGQIMAALDEVAKLEKEISMMNSEFQMAHAEMKKQNDLLEKERLATSELQTEYEGLSADFARDKEKLDWTAARLAEVNNKIAVQNAMTEKERERTKNLSESMLASATSLNNLGSGNDLAAGLPAKPKPPAPPPPASRGTASAGNLFGDIEQKETVASPTSNAFGSPARPAPNFFVDAPEEPSKIVVEDTTPNFAAPPNGVPKPTVPAVAALASTPYLRLDSFTSAGSSNTNDTASIHSATRKVNKFQALNMEAELSTAFSELEEIKEVTVAPVVTSDAFDDAFAPAKIDDDFDFDTSFSKPTSRKSQAGKGSFSVDFGSAFGTPTAGVPATPATKAPAAAQPTAKLEFDTIFGAPSTTNTTSTAAAAPAPSTTFNFDDAFGFLSNPPAGNAETTGAAIKLSTEELDAVFGGGAAPAAKPAAQAAADGFGFNTDFSTFEFPSSEPKQEAAGDDVMDEVRQLMDMGFSKEKSIAALEKNDFDVARASAWLLDGN
ncbi:hypothetical protein HDU96_005026 [Phlyctochytrium bullatum]|nr:hypothetical protein HDU96_005026 [Phlyctochytrium bullatum]